MTEFYTEKILTLNINIRFDERRLQKPHISARLHFFPLSVFIWAPECFMTHLKYCEFVL